MLSQNNVDSQVTLAGIRYTSSIRTRVRKTQPSKQSAPPGLDKRSPSLRQGCVLPWYGTRQA
jgi:hypothetical protein